MSPLAPAAIIAPAPPIVPVVCAVAAPLPVVLIVKVSIPVAVMFLAANALAAAFTSKDVLPSMPEDQFVGPPSTQQDPFVVIRSRIILKLLLELDVCKATGPDGIPARVLRELAKEICVPLAILFRRMLKEGKWPARWKLHLIVPLYKRNVVHNPNNYRGVHLTAIISKVAEKTIGNPLIAYLEQFGFGDNQWGFRKLSSARDLCLICVSSWILSFCRGLKVVAYLSDISGAFDKVFKDYMMAKLVTAGVSPLFLDFLNAYLEPRLGQVAVDGALSYVLDLTDTVFQGTVLGPTLWNTFFNDDLGHGWFRKSSSYFFVIMWGSLHLGHMENALACVSSCQLPNT